MQCAQVARAAETDQQPQAMSLSLGQKTHGGRFLNQG